MFRAVQNHLRHKARPFTTVALCWTIVCSSLAAAGGDVDPKAPRERGRPQPAAVPLRSLSELAPGMVWRVERGGRYCYLAGSVHLQSSSAADDWPLSLRAAYADCGSVCFEVDPQDLSSGRSWQYFQQFGRLPPGENLWQFLSPETRRTLDAQVPGKKQRDELAGMRPWLAAISLYQIAANSAGLHQHYGLEQTLSRRAHRDRKSVSGLDSAQEHALALARVSPAQQDLFLRSVAATIHTSATETGHLSGMWRRGDVAGLTRALDSGYQGLPDVRRQLVDLRNERWAPIISRRLAGERPPLFVVGCLHLCGEPHGLIAALHRNGCRVTPVEHTASSPSPPVVAASLPAPAPRPIRMPAVHSFAKPEL